MSKKNNDSIEKFFRKAVDQTDTNFMESDWQKMEKMLDARSTATGSPGSGILKRGAIVTALLLISASVYFLEFRDGELVSEKNSTSQMQAAAGKVAPPNEAKEKNPTADLLLSEENSNSKNVEQIKTEPIGNAKSKKLETLDEAKQERISSDNISQLKLSQQEELKNAAIKNSHLNEKRYGKSKDNVIEQEGSEENVKSSITSDQNRDESPLTSVTEVHEKAIALNNEAIIIKQQTNSVAIPTKESENKPEPELVIGDSTKKEVDVVSVEPMNEEAREDQKADGIPSRWNVAVVVAPDFSSTTFGKMSSPGKSFGFLAGYHLFSRVTVSTGFIKSSKQYNSYGKQYQPPPGYWKNRTNGIVPDEIHGQCAIVEIPVLIQFDLLQRTKSRIYLGGGISSYIMLSESYTYSFETPNPGAAEGWSSANRSSYAFSIGNMSVAYERIVASGWSVGLEPYLKIPFKGIGWSKLDLFTTGAYINIRYRFSKRSL